jgi:hypothetical protein
VGTASARRPASTICRPREAISGSLRAARTTTGPRRREVTWRGRSDSSTCVGDGHNLVAEDFLAFTPRSLALESHYDAAHPDQPSAISDLLESGDAARALATSRLVSATGALRFGDERVMALVGALCVNLHAVAGFTSGSSVPW